MRQSERNKGLEHVITRGCPSVALVVVRELEPCLPGRLSRRDKLDRLASANKIKWPEEADDPPLSRRIVANGKLYKAAAHLPCLYTQESAGSAWCARLAGQVLEPP